MMLEIVRLNDITLRLAEYLKVDSVLLLRQITDINRGRY
jgi:hypothetical protein